ncbi:hypothetical protein [Rhizobium leguminosarum]|uniref:hypothetical protein n=1 Tax=Rhizobium leguminosarum TaxID=384 RepID=UPI000FEC5D4E|nr:hypothetical protein [Rhizobium leguminosarum]RWX22089.1 hypothetical protein EHI43_36310 [Rhizobium leguminosarum]
MTAHMHSLTLPGPMLRRGFWLYVWVVETPQGDMLYVGRTGDNSSPHATAPYTRMGQHLGFAKNQNALRRHLSDRGLKAEDCASFDLVAFGPLYDEVEKREGLSRADLMKLHMPTRDIVGALEKALAEELKAAGYDVLNTVKSKHPPDLEGWSAARQAFSQRFPKLRERYD